jgi:hypothetical protein
MYVCMYECVCVYVCVCGEMCLLRRLAVFFCQKVSVNVVYQPYMQPSYNLLNVGRISGFKVPTFGRVVNPTRVGVQMLD